MAAIGVSGVIFAFIKYFSRGPPRTMTKEWQEATNEYMKVRYPALLVHLMLLLRVGRLRVLERLHMQSGGLDWRFAGRFRHRALS